MGHYMNDCFRDNNDYHNRYRCYKRLTLKEALKHQMAIMNPEMFHTARRGGRYTGGLKTGRRRSVCGFAPLYLFHELYVC